MCRPRARTSPKTARVKITKRAKAARANRARHASPPTGPAPGCTTSNQSRSRSRSVLEFTFREFLRSYVLVQYHITGTNKFYCTLHAPPGRLIRNSQKKKKSEETKLPFRGSRFFDDSSRARSLRVTPRTQNKRTSCRWETDHVRDRALSTRALSRRTFARRVRCVAPTLLFQSVVRCAGLTNHAPIGSTHRLSVLPPTWSPRRPRSTVLLVAFHLKR